MNYYRVLVELFVDGIETQERIHGLATGEAFQVYFRFPDETLCIATESTVDSPLEQYSESDEIITSHLQWYSQVPEDVPPIQHNI